MAIEELKELLEDKTIAQKCRLRLEHKAVRFYDNGKRTNGEIAKCVAIPVNQVKLFKKLGLHAWTPFLHPEIYCRWVGSQYGESFGDSARAWEAKRTGTEK